ncbi:restriction endonuclease subunit S [Pelotalea chapellei]|uniref:Restriction endonuclease subunit S n=1 Tax=Pelotalea chapellei TaxID=44671 RepID=A0ABS5U4F1_9BACT|nr:restriction endonuclease subunit S [Pelotalea chapellei]MBT1070547.1 restriction endonuclease subunit S [Pelotalea chapellei]
MSKWPVSSLQGKLHIKHGYPFKGEYFSDVGDYIVLTPGNFYEEGGFKRQAGKEKFYIGEVPKDYLHNKGDLIVAMTEQAEGLLGSCAFVPNDNLYLHNQRLGLITAEPKLLDRIFVYYLFQTSSVREQIRLTSSGSKVKHTSPERIYAVTAPLPKVEEQRKIAAALSALDAKIDCNNRINTELEAMVKTLYDYWFIQFDFPDKNGKPYKSSGGKMVYNSTLKREIPMCWEDGALDDLGQIVGGSTPSTKKADNFTTNGTPWITPNDLSDNQGNKFITRGAQDISDKGFKDASLKKFPVGTVLLSSRAPIGYMAIARNEVTTNQGFKSFVPTNGYSTAFIYYTVKNSMKVITQYASGSTFKEISGTVLKTVKVCLPKSDVVEQFTNSVEPIFKRQDTLEQENQQLAQLRDWLLPMLMNGQVTVS